MRRLSAGVAVTLLCAACNAGYEPATPNEQPPAPEVRQQDIEWVELAPVPTPRTEVAAAAARGNLYVIGGFSDAGTVATVEIYDIETDSWTDGPDLPVAVNHAMAATLAGEVYVAGGYLGPGVENQTDRAFVLRDGVWKELARMPVARGAGGLARARGKLWLVGGVEPDGIATTTFVYNPDSDSWGERKGMPTDRQHLGVAAYRGRVYVVGGRTSGLDSNRDAAERFNTPTRTWRKLPPMPTARGGLAAAATSNGFVVAAGGEGLDGTFEEAEAFDIPGGKWRRLPPLPSPRHGLGVVAVGSIVYVLAGGPQPGLTFSDANEAIDLAPLR